MIRALLIALALLVPSVSSSVTETCTITSLTGTQAFNCPTSGAETACVLAGTVDVDYSISCTGGPDADGDVADGDDLISLSGASGTGLFSCDGNILQDNSTTAGIVVGAGANFKCHADGGTRRLLSVGGAGIVATGDVDFHGRYIETDGDLVEAKTTDVFHNVGTLEWCPGTGVTNDCNDALNDTEKMRINWAHDPYDEIADQGSFAEYDYKLDSAIAKMFSGMIVCFADSNKTDAYVGADTGFCYQITGNESVADPYWIDIDITQTVASANKDTAAWPQARRNLASCPIDAAAAAGEGNGNFTVDNTGAASCSALITQDFEAVGMWARPVAGGPPRKIAWTDITGTDTVVTVWPSTPWGFAGGADIQIDYGWAEGDEFIAYHPLVIQTSSLACLPANCADVQLYGDVDIAAVVFDATNEVHVNAGATVTMWKDVWVRDHELIKNQNAVYFKASGTYENTSITGGTSSVSPNCDPAGLTCVGGNDHGNACTIEDDGGSGECDSGRCVTDVEDHCGHGLMVQNVGAATTVTNATVDGLFCRHLGDDCFNTFAGASNGDVSVTLNNVHNAFMGFDPDTASCIDSTSGNCQTNCAIRATNIVCDSNSGEAAFSFDTVGSSITNAVYYGGRAQGTPFYRDDADIPTRNLVALSYNGTGATLTNQAILTNILSNFWIQDFTSSDTLDFWDNPWEGINVSNGVIAELTTTNEAPGYMVSGTFSNVAIWESTAASCSSGNCFTLGTRDVSSAGDVAEYKNVTIAWDVNDSDREFASAFGKTGAGTPSGLTILTDYFAAYHVNRDSIHGRPVFDGDRANAGDDAWLDYKSLCVFQASKVVGPALGSPMSTAEDVELDASTPGDYTNAGNPGFANLPDNAIATLPNRLPNLQVRPSSQYRKAGCGIKSSPPPGVCRMNWALAKSKLTPFCMVHPDEGTTPGSGGSSSGGGGGGGSRLRPY